LLFVVILTVIVNVVLLLQNSFVNCELRPRDVKSVILCHYDLNLLACRVISRSIR